MSSKDSGGDKEVSFKTVILTALGVVLVPLILGVITLKVNSQILPPFNSLSSVIQVPIGVVALSWVLGLGVVGVINILMDMLEPVFKRIKK